MFLWGLQGLKKQREREREREKRERWLEEKQKADFLAYFGTGFLLSQAIKSASIYRR